MNKFFQILDIIHPATPNKKMSTLQVFVLSFLSFNQTYKHTQRQLSFIYGVNFIKNMYLKFYRDSGPILPLDRGHRDSAH